MADKEKLSALMDGELIDKALITDMEHDQEDLQTWKNYHLIGDVMRGDAPEKREWDIVGSVALALESEPEHSTFVIPERVVALDEHRIDESQPAPQQARRQRPTWLSHIGQVAVAACVSLAVILGVQQYSGSDNGGVDSSQLPVLQTVPYAGSAEPVSLTRDSVGHSNQNNQATIQEQRRRINAMLQDYELQLRLNSENQSVDSNHPETVVE